MVDEHYVTHGELQRVVYELKEDMNTNFNQIKAMITEVQTKVEEKRRDDKDKYDDRYLLKKEAMQEAISRVATPEFRKGCYPIVAEYLCTDEGQMKVNSMIRAYMEGGRDSMSKWMGFIRMVVSAALILLAIYGGGTIYRGQKDIERSQAGIQQSIDNQQ